MKSMVYGLKNFQNTHHCKICNEIEKPGYFTSRNKLNKKICDRCEIKMARMMNNNLNPN